MSLVLTYTDGSTKTVTSGFTTSGFDSSTAGIKSITVICEGKSTTFTVVVKELLTYSVVDGKIVITDCAETATSITILETSDAPIETIAAALSFANTAHFSNLFSKHVGISPTAYRKKFSRIRPTRDNDGLLF